MFLKIDFVKNSPKIFGVDFSGAVDAGLKIWVASGVVRDGEVEVKNCCKGATIPDSGRELRQCLGALRNFIANAGSTVFGLDFPFGLPSPILARLNCQNWHEFLQSFPERFPSPDAFRTICRELGGPHELKRTTDRESRTPFSPYNLRLYKQTYFGISQILRPLVLEGSVCVLPMQDPIDRKPWLVEICPRSTLIRENFTNIPYKKAKYRNNRERLLNYLMDNKLALANNILKDAILDNSSGDALDSVIALFATFRALRQPSFPFPDGRTEEFVLEGYVYL